MVQDSTRLSGFENSKWPFVKWSWDTVHLSVKVHEDRSCLDDFLKWLAQRTNGLSKQTVFKSHLQGLLLGIGLFLRDHELACFTDYEETPVPYYLAKSCMAASDADSINQMMQSISEGMQDDMGYA